jgi:hypothetical protein
MLFTVLFPVSSALRWYRETRPAPLLPAQQPRRRRAVRRERDVGLSQAGQPVGVGALPPVRAQRCVCGARGGRIHRVQRLQLLRHLGGALGRGLEFEGSRFRVYSLQFTVYSLQFTVYSLQFTV